MKHSFLVITLLSTSAMAMIKGTADFVAKANPGFLEINGQGGVVDGTKAAIKNGMLSGAFVVNVKDFKTGMDQRDGHMLGYLEADKYPQAIFVLDPISVAGGTHKAFKGTLTLHGVTKPVSGIVEMSSTKAMARFTVDVTQYKISVPTFKLLTVARDVEISVALDLQ